MRATYIPSRPPEGAGEGIPPESLAACLARYSRSNEGIEKILKESAGKSPDAIFKFIDYGHASIGGLTGGIAIAVDGISMLLAYRLFEFAQMADGQECSTRYIAIDQTGLPKPAEIGIPKKIQDLWLETCHEGFRLYEMTRCALETEIADHPETAQIPAEALDKPKVLGRMLKNYALDRARYFLPVATKTGMVLVATARIWADTLRLLESLQWPEAVKASALIRAELEKVSPNLVRHSHPDNASIALAFELMQAGQKKAATADMEALSGRAPTRCRLDIFDGPSFNALEENLAEGLTTRTNRYCHTGLALKRQTVRVQWDRVAIAELRDLNRHRTGFRFSDFSPQGFYIPEEAWAALSKTAWGSEIGPFRGKYRELVARLAREGQTGIQAYGYFLGTQVPFEHTQQADKFLYEVELRTGLGAHFKYAEHLKQAAELYFEKFPETREAIQIGKGEPE